MSKTVSTCLFASTALLMAGAHAASSAWRFNAPDDLRDIHHFEESAAAVTDNEELLTYFSEGAVAADTMAPGWLEGKQQIRVAYAPQMAPMKTLKPNVRDVNVATDGELACIAMQINVTGTHKNRSTAPLSVTFRELDFLRKIDGRWQWTHQQVFFPLDAKSGRAIIDGPLPVRGPLGWAADPLPGPAISADLAKDEIRKWVAETASASTADEMMDHFGPSDDVLLVDQFGEHRGMNEIRAYYAVKLAGLRANDTKVARSFIDSNGRLGVQLSRYDVRMTFRDGSVRTGSMRRSDCLRRIDGKWRAFFTMMSAPIDRNTGLAVG